jgi:hypothetical protein
VATTAIAPSLTFPHDPPTKIIGEPSCPAVTQLHKELCESAVSVHSICGGGQHGHLGMIVPPTECNAMNGTQPWVDPPNPGVLQIPTSAAQHQMAITTSACNLNSKEWTTWIKVTNKLKQQVLDAAGKAHLAELEDDVVGCATRTASKLLNHLVNNRQNPRSLR